MGGEPTVGGRQWQEGEFLETTWLSEKVQVLSRPRAGVDEVPSKTPSLSLRLLLAAPGEDGSRTPGGPHLPDCLGGRPSGRDAAPCTEGGQGRRSPPLDQSLTPRAAAEEGPSTGTRLRILMSLTLRGPCPL